ncbi:MAG: S46 family peptidase [Planctomycetota bacterium]
MFTTSIAALALSFLAAPDEGMWLFTNPPIDAIDSAYGVRLTPEWLEHVQKSCVRFSTGGSGSIVSADGLVMTNHHVAAEILAQLSSAERDLLEQGFYAPSRTDEVPCPDLELLALWEVRDVTEVVKSAGEGLESPAEAGAARRAAMSRLESEFAAETGLKPELVTLYQGGQYHLYGYRRFTDVRLVFAPEKAAAFFGGDPDNFEYPRYCLDVTFLRIYENGEPLAAEHHLAWGDGADAEELVFVAGHPGSTERLNTVRHLEYFRDVRYPKILQRLWRREVQLQTFSQGGAEHARIAEDELFGIQNSRKALTGRLEGLNDPVIMDAKLDAERQLKAFVWSEPARSTKWGDAWDEIARAQAVQAAHLDRITAVQGGGSQLYNFARSLVRAGVERQKPSEDRLREYSDAALPRLAQRLGSAVPIYPDLEADAVRSWLSWLSENLGGDDPLTVRGAAWRPPRAPKNWCANRPCSIPPSARACSRAGRRRSRRRTTR